jgi:hypothetical protein
MAKDLLQYQYISRMHMFQLLPESESRAIPLTILQAVSRLIEPLPLRKGNYYGSFLLKQIPLCLV